MREGLDDGRMLRLESQKKLAALSLKKCPLCDAINAVANDECFVCRWAGQFDRDAEAVDAGLGELLTKCPELVDAMLCAPVRPSGVWSRLRLQVREFLNQVRNLGPTG